ncbi:hypothetical protein niasHT_039494 [Heterodera trifolii]|uniref:Uncharacterized protein n=1 Tax=Heterodera trifolii TaxID=157864 RepID=A0ABD2HWI3_9BILA
MALKEEEAKVEAELRECAEKVVKAKKARMEAEALLKSELEKKEEEEQKKEEEAKKQKEKKLKELERQAAELRLMLAEASMKTAAKTAKTPGGDIPRGGQSGGGSAETPRSDSPKEGGQDDDDTLSLEEETVPLPPAPPGGNVGNFVADESVRGGRSGMLVFNADGTARELSEDEENEWAGGIFSHPPAQPRDPNKGAKKRRGGRR